jgi:hypothetical protein
MYNFKAFRSFIAYYMGSAGALWAAKAALQVDIGVYAIIAVFGALVPTVASYVWLETRDDRKKDFESKAGWRETSFLFDLMEALERVREADPNDEGIAELANQIIRSDLDKKAIKYTEYQQWRARNTGVFSAFVDEANNLIGFFDIFPLTDDATERILSGQLKENKLAVSDILPEMQTAVSRNIYVASLMINKEQKTFHPKIAKEIMVIKLYNYIGRKYEPLEDKRILAYAHTTFGESLLRRAGFTMIRNARNSVQRRPLYLLEPMKASAARERYKRIERRLAALATP